MRRAASCLGSVCSDAGSSLYAGGLDVQEELHCVCVSTHPETEEQGTLQG